MENERTLYLSMVILVYPCNRVNFLGMTVWSTELFLVAKGFSGSIFLLSLLKFVVV